MIGVAIYDILKNDSDVAAVVSAKIYPINAREEDSVPYITYRIISDVPANTKQTAALIDRYRVQISSFATKHKDAVYLGRKVREVLDNHALGSYTYTESDPDYTIKVSSIDFDGEISLGLTEANVFEIAQDYIVTAYISQND